MMAAATARGLPAGPRSPVLCGAGDVVLEVGGNIGAGIVFTGPELEGDEMEIHPSGAPWLGTHVAVRERRLGTGSRWAALFVPLRAGNYEVRLKDQPFSPTLSMVVEGGRVAQVEWPAGQVPRRPRFGGGTPHEGATKMQNGWPSKSA
jgi:hypothetical protein